VYAPTYMNSLGKHIKENYPKTYKFMSENLLLKEDPMRPGMYKWMAEVDESIKYFMPNVATVNRLFRQFGGDKEFHDSVLSAALGVKLAEMTDDKIYRGLIEKLDRARSDIGAIEKDVKDSGFDLETQLTSDMVEADTEEKRKSLGLDGLPNR